SPIACLAALRCAAGGGGGSLPHAASAAIDVPQRGQCRPVQVSRSWPHPQVASTGRTAGRGLVWSDSQA
ncbi:MAG: hypothetical protein WBQ50_03520, partial [Nocardioides sp.]